MLRIIWPPPAGTGGTQSATARYLTIKLIAGCVLSRARPWRAVARPGRAAAQHPSKHAPTSNHGKAPPHYSGPAIRERAGGPARPGGRGAWSPPPQAQVPPPPSLGARGHTHTSKQGTDDPTRGVATPTAPTATLVLRVVARGRSNKTRLRCPVIRGTIQNCATQARGCGWTLPRRSY